MLIFRRLALVLALVLLANFAVWAAVNRSVAERAWGGIINGLSYSAWQAGDTAKHASDADIDRDMAILAGHTNAIRTYGVSDGLDRLFLSRGGMASMSISAHGSRVTRAPTRRKSRMSLMSPEPIPTSSA